MILNLKCTADIEPGKNCYKTFSLGGQFLNDTITLENVPKKITENILLFGNNKREFVTLLQKQPKNKSEHMLLSLIKKKECHCHNNPFIGLLIFGGCGVKIEHLLILDLRSILTGDRIN